MLRWTLRWLFERPLSESLHLQSENMQASKQASLPKLFTIYIMNRRSSLGVPQEPVHLHSTYLSSPSAPWHFHSHHTHTGPLERCTEAQAEGPSMSTQSEALPTCPADVSCGRGRGLTWHWSERERPTTLWRRSLWRFWRRGWWSWEYLRNKHKHTDIMALITKLT